MVNQQRDAPLEYYRTKFRGIDPADAARRTGLAFDPHCGCFEIKVLSHTIFAEWPEYRLHPAFDQTCPKTLYGFGMEIIVARYIIEGADMPSHGGFKAYRELPWGEVYDANFRGRCINRLANSFGARLEMFEKAADALGGLKSGLGDVSYDLPFLGSVVCRLILWGPDEEFPPSAQFLFSDNTQFAFNAEDLSAVGEVVIGALKETSGCFPTR